jgi:uncharacterized membrane protein YczE
LTSRDRRLPRRLLQLYAGLVLYGVSMALMVRSSLGVMPWDVLHQGLSRQLGWSLGLVTVVIGAVVLLAWIPLRERPGLGTVLNVLVVSLAIDVTVWLAPAPEHAALRVLALLGGIAVVGLASAIYLGVDLGPGPRDGWMTGLHRRTGAPLWLVRLGIEGSVVVAGWLLGGTVGAGTLAFALLIGPAVDAAVRLLRVQLR